MNFIRPHCRLHLTAADVDFILSTLGRSPGDAAALRDLLTDEGSRDGLLDQPVLYRAVLEGSGCLAISPHLYFYLLVRHALLAAGVKERELADYIAEMLGEFTRTECTRARLPGDPSPLDYFYEMLAALPRLEPRQAFALRLHMGNQALYHAGLFRERIEHRASRKGFPGVDYYERMGQASFAAASHDRWAGRLGLERLLEALAECFHAARLALNDLTERLISLGDGNAGVDRLLVRIGAAG